MCNPLSITVELTRSLSSATKPAEGAYFRQIFIPLAIRLLKTVANFVKQFVVTKVLRLNSASVSQGYNGVIMNRLNRLNRKARALEKHHIGEFRNLTEGL